MSVRRADPDELWMGKAFEGPRVTGAKAFAKKDYRTAIEAFARGAELARSSGDEVTQGRFLANEGGAHMFMGENRPAIQCLLQARTLLERSEDWQSLQGVETNLANVYVLTGDYEAAAAAAERGARIRPKRVDRERQVRILMSFGRAMAKARGVDAAAPIWREALAGAEAANSRSLEADILELWGYELGEQGEGRMEEAEEALARAWYRRKLANDAARMPLTEGKLARLYRKRGATRTAQFWMERTLRVLESGQKIPMPEWILRAEAAHVASDAGQLGEALEGYRKAMRLAETWQNGLPALERLRLGAEKRMVQELFDGYLRTAGRLYRRGASAALAAEMFTVIQNTRAWSLDGHETSTGAEGPLYAEARRLEARWLTGDAQAGEYLKTARAAILEREAAAPGTAATQRGKLEAPGAGEAVLTFWLDEEGSWLWVWTKDGLRMAELAARERILESAGAFRRAIEENREDSRTIGLALRRLLLGNQEEACLRSPHWDIVADEGLFQIPFGALPGRGARYLAEDIETRLVPNALRKGMATAASRRFFAVADPIFNSADERQGRSWNWQRVVLAGSGATTLPRLPGTGREAEAARAAWRAANYETAVYSGPESNEAAVLARLAEWHPRVIHFGTHTLEAQGRPRLVLSMRPDGSAGLLTAEDIAAMRLRAEVVVMSACHSAGTEAARGAGLLGLTRAWLTAGARQVVSTLWPVGDESTAFFSTFYGHLASGDPASPLAAASSLRQAQLAAIHSGGIAAQPRQWAGHVLLARR
ncbi:MAG: CHAT domain-containing protein [Bryobacterales bacterium]|nr:CHAT domain-containing protein [Bryobacterales bacterium]